MAILSSASCIESTCADWYKLDQLSLDGSCWVDWNFGFYKDAEKTLSSGYLFLPSEVHQASRIYKSKHIFCVSIISQGLLYCMCDWITLYVNIMILYVEARQEVKPLYSWTLSGELILVKELLKVIVIWFKINWVNVKCFK